MSGSPLSSSRFIGYVQAGGASSRFGSDKSLAEIGGKSMLQHACDVLRGAVKDVRIVAPVRKYAVPGIVLVPDRWPGEGPLGGIVTALSDAACAAHPAAWALIVSSDMPFLTADWLRYMLQLAANNNADVLLPHSTTGPEPLCACWKVSAAASLEETFLVGTRKITDALRNLKTEVLDGKHWKRFDTAGRLFWNINTPADFAEASRIWSEQQP
jgi:molybdopterin-guanine dinucleotide biosynthesis protein A